MPKPRVVDVRIHVVLHKDMLVLINIAMCFDEALGHMRINVTDGSVIGAVNNTRAVFLRSA